MVTKVFCKSGSWFSIYETCDAAVGRLEVGDEVLAARLDTEQLGVGYGDDAAGTSIAAQLHMVEYVGKTAHVVVDRQTSPDPHAAVARGRDQHHLVVTRTCRVKCLPLTVLLHRRHQHCNRQQQFHFTLRRPRCHP